MNQNYFITPFGLAGDQTAVPVALDPSGGISFNQGWGVDYQRDLATDPLAKSIDRTNMNYLLFVITQAIKQYQENGAPEFITTTNTGGAPFPYMTGNVVRFSADNGVTIPFAPYVSLVDNNTDAPNTAGTTKWQLLVFQIASQAEMQAMTANNRLVTPANIAWAIQQYIANNPVSSFTSGQMIQYAGTVPPTGALAANGAAVSRTTYAKLFAAIGTTYGAGDGSTTFNLPNVSAGSVLRSSGTGYAVGANDNGTVLSHNHAATTDTQGAHVHNGSSTNTVANHTHTGTTGGESVNHTHSGTTDGIGNHTHDEYTKTGTFQGTSGSPNVTGLQGTDVGVTTAPAGAHTHTFTSGIESAAHSHSFTSNGAGTHNHTLTLVSDGSHTHNVTVAATGSTGNIAAGLNVLHCIAY